MRSRKYQEGLDAADRRPREGGHSPLDSADVRVQVPRVVGDFPLVSDGGPTGAADLGDHSRGQRSWPWLYLGTWWALGLLTLQGTQYRDSV